MATKEIEGIADANDESSGDDTRIVITLKRDAPGADHPQQPLQAHAAADDVRGEHRGAGRRRAPHAEPARRACATTSSTRSRSSPGGRSSACDKAQQAGPHRRGPAQGARPDRRDHRRHPGVGRQGRGPRRAAWPTPFEFSEVQAEHILDMQLHRLTRLGRANLEEEMEELRRTIAELEAILADRSRAADASSRTSWARSARSTPTSAGRRSPTTSATSTSRTSSTTRTSSSRCRPRAT